MGILIHNPQEIGQLVRRVRKIQRLTQTELAGVTGVGVRFIVDLEKGKDTCQLGKTLQVLHMLGIHFQANGKTL